LFLPAEAADLRALHSFPTRRSSDLADPNVVLVGEMRDLETISLALTAAELGLLVMGTLHTKSAAQTISRVADAFPVDQQVSVRRSEEHTSELQSRENLVCRLLLEKK